MANQENGTSYEQVRRQRLLDNKLRFELLLIRVRMSKQSQLPPRCPLQKKQTGSAISPFSMSTCKDTGSRSRGGHNKSMSQSSILGEQPSWLNDLLNDSDSSSTGMMHRRSASDSLALFNGLDVLPNLDQLNEVEIFDTDETDSAIESSCTYGPNSPRRKDKQSFPESEIVSAFSEYVVQNPVQHLDGHITVSGIGIPQSDSFSGGCASADVMDNEANPPKRHPGQRSRVRKLQYIAELERTVNVLQNVGSELSVRVATLLQQHAALSMENTTLKQQLIRMQQEKFIVDSEYQSLQEQLKRLKTGLAFRQNRKVHNWPKSAAGNMTQSDAIWEMIDMAKLDLN